jgi:hypothetical protein
VTELAYKFTQPVARSPFTGFTWPVGNWVEAKGALGLCANGIHACRVEALPRWIDEELWRIELDGIEQEHEGVLVARRGRLLEPIAAWDAEAARDLARSCAARVKELAAGHADELLRRRAAMIPEIANGEGTSATALSMYTTAHAAEEVMAGGYRDERRRQSEWLRARLRLA